MPKHTNPLLGPALDPESSSGGKTESGLAGLPPLAFDLHNEGPLHETRPGRRIPRLKTSAGDSEGAVREGKPANGRAGESATDTQDTMRTARDTVPDAHATAAHAAASRAADHTADAAARSPESAPGALLAGRFKLLHVLGKGPFGTVYEAEDRELDAFVAVKVLPERLTREPKIMDRVRKQLSRARGVVHPNVGRIFDVNRDGESHFVVMEYVPGRTLEEEIQVGMTAETARTRFMQVLDALQAIHAMGLVHGAVDASHIRLRSDGALKMTSTGLSCELLHGTDLHPHDHRCESPEQKQGQHATTRSDVYAAGALLRSLLRAAKDAPSIAYLHDIADRCMELDPANRFASIPSLLEEIERLTQLADNRLPSTPIQTAPSAAIQDGNFQMSEVPVATVGLVTVATLRGVRGIWRMRLPLPVVLLAVLLYVFVTSAKEAAVAVENPSVAKGQFFGWLADEGSSELGVTPIETARVKVAPSKGHRHRRASPATTEAAPALAPTVRQEPGLPSEGAYFYAPDSILKDIPDDVEGASDPAATPAGPPPSPRHTHTQADAYRTF